MSETAGHFCSVLALRELSRLCWQPSTKRQDVQQHQHPKLITATGFT
jgi:hypothetical protein